MKATIQHISHIFSEIKHSLNGEERDYTIGSVKRAIFLLSVPMVLEMLMESIFAIADIYFVGKLGVDAIATVGLTESLITLIYAISMGLGVAASAMVSRRIGEKDYKRASETALQAIIVGIFISLIIAIPGVFFSRHILGLMGASDTIVAQMSGYTTIMLGGNITIVLLFIINAIFRSAGNPVISMKVLWFANITNIVLDPLLIFGIGPFPEMGISGAAWATNIGRGLAVLYQLFLLFDRDRNLSLRNLPLKIDLKIITELLRLSFGTISQHIVVTSSWVILMRIMSIFGSAALAGYTIAIRIIIFAILPASGISNAASTLVGQNLGAKNPTRAEQSAWITAKINVALCTTIGIILVIWAKFFIQIFTSDADVILLGAQGLRIISIGFIAYGLGMVLINSLNGAGETRIPFRINLICYWAIEIPLAYILAKALGLGQIGVFYSILIAETIMTIMAYYVFKRGNWKNKIV